MSMRVINWEEYICIGNREWGMGNGDCCSDDNIASELNHDTSNRNPYSLLPTPHSLSLALTIGVFDGVHLGHQALIRRICSPTTSSFLIPTVVTFKQNPLKILRPGSFAGDIYPLEKKIAVFEELGVRLTVLIDFSGDFCKMSGGGFIDLLLGSPAGCRPVKLIALGRDFRCGHGLDTGVEEIRDLAAAKGVETWVAEPVMDNGRPVSSSRIREALAAGRIAEAERLMGRPVDQ